MAVLVDTLKALSSDLRWWSCNMLSTQDHTMDFITYDDAVFSWMGESLKELWDYIMNALIQPEDDVKDNRPDLIVDYEGYTTLLIH